jgi:lambda repressor-like predicted transcriptional regulator
MTPGSPLDKAQARPRTRGEARRALLRERGVSLSDIARDLGKNLSVVSRVNGGQRRSREIEAAIAQSLGLAMREAFPEWYSDPRPGEH